MISKINLQGTDSYKVIYDNGQESTVAINTTGAVIDEVNEAKAGGTEKYPTAIVVEPELTEAELLENARTENNNNVIAQIEALEKTLSRPLREYALDNTNQTALDKLTQVEADIAILRTTLI